MEVSIVQAKERFELRSSTGHCVMGFDDKESALRWNQKRDEKHAAMHFTVRPYLPQLHLVKVTTIEEVV